MKRRRSNILVGLVVGITLMLAACGTGTRSVATVVLDAETLSLVRTQTHNVVATVIGAPEDNNGVTWSSDNEAVVSVAAAADGSTAAALTAVGTGTATVTASTVADPSVTASVEITVSALGLSISHELLDPRPDRSGSVTATIAGNFDGGSNAVTWSVDPSAALALDSSTSDSGAANAFTTVGSGQITVTATSVQDPAVSAQEVITVHSVVLDPMNVYVGPWVSAPDPSAEAGTYFNPLGGIQAGINAASDGGTVHLADDTYAPSPAYLSSFKPISIVGQSQAGVQIDLSAGTAYGIEISGRTEGMTGVRLENLTVTGPSATAGSDGQKFGIRVFNVSNVEITNVTVEGSTRSELDLNAVTNAVLTNVTLDGTTVDTDGNPIAGPGVGLALTNTTNVTAIGLTTTGNEWGGVGVWPSLGADGSGVVDGVSIDASSNLTDAAPLYVTAGAGLVISNLSIAGFEFAARPGDASDTTGSTRFFQTLAAACASYDPSENPTVLAVNPANAWPPLAGALSCD